jgi:hypothetical protein
MEASRQSLLNCGLGSHSLMSPYTVRLKALPVIVPSRLQKCPVLSMNMKSGWRNFRSVRRAGMLDALRVPILFLSTIWACLCAGHKRRKCHIVSSLPRLHKPHPRLSATLMAHKCQFSGACPVRRRMRREVWRRVSPFTSFRYELEGSFLSIRLTQACCFDCCQRLVAHAFVCLLKAWVIAAALRGVGSCSSGGRSSSGDKFSGPLAAAFASSSAASLLSIPMCLGVHLTVSVMSVSRWSLWIFCWNVSTAHWPRPCQYRWHPMITAWLSTPIETRCGAFGSMRMRCATRMIPTPSAACTV